MWRRIGKYFLRFIIVVLTTLLILVGVLYGVMYKICHGPSQEAKATFITTILETGQLKFIANMVCSKEEINEIVNNNKMEDMNTDIDRNLIQIGKKEGPSKDPKNPVEKEEVFPRIKQRMFTNNGTMLDSTTNYMALVSRRQFDRIDTLSWDYMMLPVWFMTFDYKGKLWEYAVNGQSGKAAGELPISKGKLAAFCIIIAALITLAIFFYGNSRHIRKYSRRV